MTVGLESPMHEPTVAGCGLGEGIPCAARQAFCEQVDTSPQAGQPAGSGHCVVDALPTGRHVVLVDEDSERRPELAHTLAFLDCLCGVCVGCR